MYDFRLIVGFLIKKVRGRFSFFYFLVGVEVLLCFYRMAGVVAKDRESMMIIWSIFH